MTRTLFHTSDGSEHYVNGNSGSPNSLMTSEHRPHKNITLNFKEKISSLTVHFTGAKCFTGNSQGENNFLDVIIHPQ